MRLDNRQDLDKLRAAMNTALAKVADELGLEKLRVGKVSYEIGGAGARIIQKLIRPQWNHIDRETVEHWIGGKL